MFCQIDTDEKKLTVLEEILTFRKAEQLNGLIKIDHRILKDFNIDALNYAIRNVLN